MPPFAEFTKRHASALGLSRINRNDLDFALVEKQIEFSHDDLAGPGFQDDRGFNECGGRNQALVISKNQIDEMRALRLVEKDGHQG